MGDVTSNFSPINMRIKSIQLKNFKRFTELTISHIPEMSKLVLLIGANGSGKSSLFDAFGLCTTHIKQDGAITNEFWSYFQKNNSQDTEVEIDYYNHAQTKLSKNSFHTIGANHSHTFYGRTSFRQIPRLTRTALGQGGPVDFTRDSDRPMFFIERDNRFENDIEKITEIILKELFRQNQSNEQIKEKYINPVNAALSHIFGSESSTKLELIEIIPPLEGKVAQINFRKGNSEIHYNYLSAGEKEVFNLLINLLSRSSLYQDTIYYFDEIDLHLNTKLQFNLLKELTENWIPENCQLWTATHSLGFIEYAKQNEHATIIDFDSLNFDVPQTITPEPKENPEVYDIAVGKEFLSSLFVDMNIYFVENKDKEYYAMLGLGKKIFVSENNRNNVYHKVRTSNYYGIIDRDFLSDDDIQHIREKYTKLYVLEYYSIENYLYHPDNLEEYYVSNEKEFDKQSYIKQLTAAKKEIKDSIIPTLSLKRTEYPFFGEPEYNGKPLQNRFKNKQENADQSIEVASYLNSNDFETYYKSLPMKTYCKLIPQRQHISKSDLAKTEWFKNKISLLLQQDSESSQSASK